MPYSVLRLNTTESGFPLLSEFSGRSVSVANLDQNDNTPASTGLIQANPEKRNPSIIYCENVLPTANGIKSVSFRQIVGNYIVPPLSWVGAGTTTWDIATQTWEGYVGVTTSAEVIQDIFEVRGQNEAISYIATTNGAYVLLYNTTTNQWVEIPFSAGDYGAVTVATVLTGLGVVTYVCFQGVGIYSVDLVAFTLTPIVFTTGSNILITAVAGILSVFNYLILYDDISIQWSSAFNPLDFNPAIAIETGTGFGTPTGIAGSIIGVQPTSYGFMVFTVANAISATWSGNAQYPWTFAAIPNSSGISALNTMCIGEGNTVYAWTVAGLFELTQTAAAPLFPEVTDFLTGFACESYDLTTEYLTPAIATDSPNVAVHYLCTRYLIISYTQYTDGNTPAAFGYTNGILYNYALVYDTALNRWGKLKVNHTSVIELNIPGVSRAAKNLAFLQIDGSILLLDQDFESTGANSVVIIGKLTLDRSSMCQLLAIAIENCALSDTNFSLSIGSSYDGKIIDRNHTTPYLNLPATDSKQYNSRVTGVNHALFIQGDFHLVSLEVTLARNGSR